jgi:hypothetical protein
MRNSDGLVSSEFMIGQVAMRRYDMPGMVISDLLLREPIGHDHRACLTIPVGSGINEVMGKDSTSPPFANSAIRHALHIFVPVETGTHTWKPEISAAATPILRFVETDWNSTESDLHHYSENLTKS